LALKNTIIKILVVIPQIIDGVPTPQVFFLGKALTEIFSWTADDSDMEMESFSLSECFLMPTQQFFSYIKIPGGSELRQ
jgi:hypothetical protein